MVYKIAHPKPSSLSLLEQGHLAGIHDAGMSVYKIHNEIGASKASVLKYTSAECPLQAQPSHARLKRKTTQEENDAVSTLN